ncbi:MAG: ABC transporter substrate-binding protein [Halioglobus sp.]|nr:ABC transporter substrate-binding protein [Halioglobus sp.]
MRRAIVARVQLAWLAGLFLLAAGVLAQGGNESPHEVVNEATQDVMAAVVEAGAYVDKDPERYYQQVQAILDPVIDFRGFARSVMGPYASSERYRSLDAAGQTLLREQLDRFTEVMRLGLVRTYSKGLLAYGGSRIEVMAAADQDSAANKASVKQLVYSGQPEPYVLIYQMGRASSGEWQLRNIVIEGVNLGEIYRNQFEASARKHNGDLNAVIDSWTAVEVKTT